MQDAMILHICSAAEWQASHDDHYRCASLDHEGFIHCSRPEQVVEVAGRLFQGRRDLVLLVIDPELVVPSGHDPTHSYRGERVVWHGGDFTGTFALMTMLPDRGVGVAVFH